MPSLLRRLWIYQRERFPLLGHGPLILCFSLSAMAFSALLHGDVAAFLADPRHWLAATTAFLTCLIFFLQLRIADEFKDYEEDCQFRPYRPVPRGLISLRLLAVIFILGAAMQLALALWLETRLVIVLVIAWAYLALMSREFFAREWLKARPITYLWTHMLIMPIVDLYATACHWMVRDFPVSPGLKWFLAASFFNGIVIETGRKLRAAEDEETGVPTYTRLWGLRRAPWVWWAMLAATAATGMLAAREIGWLWPVASVLGIGLMLAAALVRGFMHRPAPGSGKTFELFSGLWTILLYLTLGIIPFAWRFFAK
jgi:4-hydroxybenzoate polyprenyltransferase